MSEEFFSIITPRCKTCGSVIGGAKCAIYNILRSKRMRSIMEIGKGDKPDDLPENEDLLHLSTDKLNNTLIDPEININTDDILDALNITNLCCRVCLITWKKF